MMPIKTNHQKFFERGFFAEKKLHEQQKKLEINNHAINIAELNQNNLKSLSLKNREVLPFSGTKLVRDRLLAMGLKQLYNNQCHVCKRQVNTPNGYKSEAHHIRPYNSSHQGNDCLGNMIVLCPNCHLQFDELYYAIEPNEMILYCFDKNDDFCGMKIETKPGHQLQIKYLKYTWDRFINLEQNQKGYYI